MNGVQWRLVAILAGCALGWIAWATNNRSALMWGLISVTALTLSALLQTTEDS